MKDLNFRKIVNSKYFLFLTLSFLTYFFYGFYNYFFLQPQGFHFSRQTDSLAFIYNYISNGFDFFNTANYNLNSIEARATSEFPVFYFVYAFVIKYITGHYYIVRILNLFLVYFSLFYLYKTLHLLLNKVFLSVILTFLFFSSTILIHYSCNFLPDVNCIALCFIGNYFSLKHLKENSLNSFHKATFFHTLNVLIKPSYIIYLLAFFFMSSLNKLRFKQYLIICISIVSIAAWVFYIKYYNNKYHQYYYLTNFKPLWAYNAEEIDEVFDFILNYWYSKYYYQSTFHLFFVLLFISPYLIYKNFKHYLSKLVIVLFLGIIAYFLLFFKQFKDHDYYFITMIPAISIIISYLVKCLIDLFHSKWIFVTISCIITLITFLSINYSQEKMQDRYSKSFISGSMIGYNLQNCDKFLDSINISKDKKFLILGDETPNGGLFFIKRKGWTVADLEGKNESYFKDKLIKTDYLIISPQQKRYFNKKSYICYNTDDIIKFRNNLIIKIK